MEAKQNYELLKRDVEDLNYISTDRNYFYVCVDGSVYGIDLRPTRRRFWFPA